MHQERRPVHDDRERHHEDDQTLHHGRQGVRGNFCQNQQLLVVVNFQHWANNFHEFSDIFQIGAKTYGPDASAEKAAKQDASYAGTKKPFGFSVLGMSVYHGGKKDEFKVLNKEYGKNLNKDNIQDFVNVFFDKANETAMTQALLSVFLARLKAIQEMYSNQRVFHIFGSSILFVYDASILLDLQASSEAIESAVVVKMIDFAHVHPANGEPDQNYNFGLDSLIKTLEGTTSA